MAHRPFQPLLPRTTPGAHDHMVECLTQLFRIHPAAQTRAKRGNRSWIYSLHQRRWCSDSQESTSLNRTKVS